MRLHRLEITAFGPFADTVTIDFDALSAAGLFLLSGPTGAGKTSVLDAVCFALYGDVPGDRSSAKRLRCDQAPPDRAPQVTLETTLAGRRFRLVRSPAWERPKKRGSGTTQQQAAVTVSEQIDGGWTPLSSRLDETGHLVTRLLGMNLPQFTQVAMLPQGRFQAFLRARSEDRHRLLQQLFRTGRFEQVEQWLRDHRRQLRRVHTAHHARVVEVVSRISEAADAPLPGWEPDDLAEPLSTGAVQPWAERLLAEVAEGAEQARAAATSSAAAETAAREALDRARHRHRLRSRLVAARAEQAELLAADDQHDAAVRRIGAAERTVDVAARHRLLERARGSAEQAAQTRAATRAALPESVTDELARLGAARVEAETAAARLPDLAEQHRVLQSRLAAAAEVERFTVQVADARSAWQVAKGEVLDRREQLLAVREARLEGIAAELAGALAVGGCCPVCGSAEHPHPAAAAAGAPDAAAEKAAQRAVDDAAVDEQVHADQVRSLEQRLAAATARRGDDPAAVIQQAIAELDDRRATLQSLAAELPRHLDAVRRLEAAATTARETEAAAAQAAAAVAEAERAVAEAARDAGFDSVDDALAAVLSDTALARLREQVRRHGERWAAVRAVLAEEHDDDGSPLPDLEQLTAADDAAATAASRARTRFEVATTRHTRLTALRDDLAQAIAGWAPVHEQLATVTRIAALTDGTSSDNQLRMRLSAFVLSYRLTQVVAAANQRLAPMSDRRYRLEHTGRRGAGESRGGLSLLVRDDWSGEARDPATLSGGETFVVSLALALGLADVITTETAGTDLDTLFVDEGFGSLDADTLDDVMDTLDTLREGGRVVGVVSHVAEMRDRIPTRLTVAKSPRGSSASIVSVGG